MEAWIKSSATCRYWYLPYIVFHRKSLGTTHILWRSKVPYTQTHANACNNAPHENFCSINTFLVPCCSFWFGVLLLTCPAKLNPELHHFRSFCLKHFICARSTPCHQNRPRTRKSHRELPNRIVGFCESFPVSRFPYFYTCFFCYGDLTTFVLADAFILLLVHRSFLTLDCNQHKGMIVHWFVLAHELRWGNRDTPRTLTVLMWDLNHTIGWFNSTFRAIIFTIEFSHPIMMTVIPFYNWGSSSLKTKLSELIGPSDFFQSGQHDLALSYLRRF